MTLAQMKLAIIAGEVSGDLLGADLITALKTQVGQLELVGVGGEALAAVGLDSLFDYSELSIMGITQVLARLPQLLLRIRQTARAIIAARPDILLIIDSPDFTHRVARIVRRALPDLPIVNYVCPSVWAWKAERAPAMRAYVDHVLAVLPFEPGVMQALDGPPTTYIGHRLVSDPDVLGVRASQAERTPGQGPKTCLLLPGSRASEIRKLLPEFGLAMRDLLLRNPDMRFLLPTVPRQERLVREIIADWPVKPEVGVGPQHKWLAFRQTDAALAASGTVLLELALCRIPVVSTYKVDGLIRLMHSRIRIWSGALPNIIADDPFVPEYLNEAIRAGALSRWIERLSGDTLARKAMLAGYDTVWRAMATERPAGEAAAAVILSLLDTKKPGHR